jgi:hypothetical protein
MRCKVTYWLTPSSSERTRGIEVGSANVLEHTDGHDPVIAILLLAVICQAEFDAVVQTLALRALDRFGMLLGRERQANDRNIVFPRQVQSEPAPPATNVQYPLAGFQ